MENAEALAAEWDSYRNVTIEITNLTSGCMLKHPKVFLRSGYCHTPPQPTIRSKRTEVCNFSRSYATVMGVVGVLTYDIYERGAAATKLAIMFSVPYDYGLFKNWVAVGIFPVARETNRRLYKEMYAYWELKGFARQEGNGCGLTYESDKMDVMVTMSPMGKAIMKVELWDKDFDP
ncbi:DELTA-actitoxin-Aeq1b-like [Stigmatopora nigra]